MTHYIQYTIEDGATILVEAAVEPDEDQSGVVRAGLKDKAGETVAQAKATFEEGLETIRHNAQVFIKKVRELPDPPDEVEVAFGLKATGEVGNFAIAKAGAEANYTVTMTWKREQTKKRKAK
jgi:hypothetical protein